VILGAIVLEAIRQHGYPDVERRLGRRFNAGELKAIAAIFSRRWK